MTVLEKLINDLTTNTTLDKDTVVKLYNQEFEKCHDEEEAARKVHRRIEFYII